MGVAFYSLILSLALGCQTYSTFDELPFNYSPEPDQSLISLLNQLTLVSNGLNEDRNQLGYLISDIKVITDMEKVVEGQCSKVLNSFDLLQETMMEQFSATSRQCSISTSDIVDRLDTEKNVLEGQFHHFREMLSTVSAPSLPTPEAQVSGKPKNCMQAKNLGKETGVTKIYFDGVEKEVYCDQDTDGGGWLALLKRQKQKDEQLSFRKNMNSYVAGFGNPAEEYWLGLEILNDITSEEPQELLVKMATKTESAESFYGKFSVSDASHKYSLLIDDYDAAKSTGGDSLSYHNLMDFSTYDSDNDKASGGSCSEWSGGGGWWFNYCYMTNPTGVYGGEKSFLEASDSYLEWREWQGYHTYLSTFTMFVRPAEKNGVY